ncbi:MAG TPA: flagellar hook-length control protein [Thermoanaerobaculia bacterium]|nr:flagellar hook-length control protein [Thermoanaerobaculia bacterium]
MTWGKLSHNSSNGADRVNCNGCDAYSGDTDCTTNLPILCYKYDGSAVPSGLTPSFYDGWKYGHIALTLPVRGSDLTSLADANAICAYHFGPGYEIAEFHHNLGGWGWWAFGNIRGDQRFWVYINDTSANCWN